MVAEFVAGRCVNCDGTPVTVASPLYCSQGCRQAAELVRYVRSATADGRIAQADVREAVQMRMAMVLAGGYPEAERRVSAALRRAVFERAGGKCEECGRDLDFDGSSDDPDAVATIQHKAGNSNDVENLAAFCRRCNNADAQAKFVPVQPGSPQALLAQELRIRWTAPKPLRACDDHETWGSVWRRYNREAKELLQARTENPSG